MFKAIIFDELLILIIRVKNELIIQLMLITKEDIPILIFNYTLFIYTFNL